MENIRQNKKSKTQFFILRITEAVLCFGIMGFVVLGFKFIISVDLIFGLVWMSITIPIILMLFILEYINAKRIIKKVSNDKDGFTLFYKNKKKVIEIPYDSIFSREKCFEEGQECVKYKTKMDFKAYFICKKGEIISLLFDNEIFEKIDKGYKKWKKSNKST